MSTTDELLDFQKKIRKKEKELDKKRGLLESYYQQLRELLDVDKKTTNIQLIPKAKELLKALEKKQEKQEKVLETLMIKIEKVMDEWEE